MKKIAFIKNGEVALVFNTDESLFDIFMNSDAKLDVTDNADVNTGWKYDGTNFSAPEIIQSNDPIPTADSVD
jgi:hypothetical protein